MSNDPENRPLDDSEWAARMATRKSVYGSGPSNQVEATPQQIQDLELDSTLHAFDRISRDTNFVNRVMRKAAESKLDPVLKINSDQGNSNVPTKRLATVAPRNLNRTLQPEADHGPEFGRGRVLGRVSMIASCLVIAAFSAYCLIPNNTIDQRKTADSLKPATPEKILVQTEDFNSKAPPAEIASDHSLESFKQPQDHRASAPVEVANRSSENDWTITEERSNARVGTTPEKKTRRHVPPSLAARDQPKTPEHVIHSDKTWDLNLSLDQRGNGALTINNELVSDDVLVIHSPEVLRGIGSEAAKRLAFLQPRIGKRIGGSITIWDQRYDFEAPAEIEQTIEEAVVQLEIHPRKTQLQKIRTEQINERAKSVRLQSSTARRRASLSRMLEISTHRQTNFKSDAGRAKAVAAMVELMLPKHESNPISTEQKTQSFTPQQLARYIKIKESLFASHRFFPSSDEVIILDEAVTQTETFLRDLASEQLAWDQEVVLGKVSEEDVAVHSRSQESLAIENQISDLEFEKFARNQSELAVPIEDQEVRAKPLIQHLSSLELKTQLRESTRSYDLFADVSAFESAVNFVNRKIRDKKIKDSKMKLPKKSNEIFEPLKNLLVNRHDLKGLPLVMGEECRLSKRDASVQASVSTRMGSALGKFDSFGNRNIENDCSLRTWSISAEIKKCCEQGSKNPSQSLATLDQMMQIDHTRLVLDVINNLRETQTDAAIDLLAKRAKFDLRPEVRFSATQALEEFPKEKYRAVLLEGFKYPWYVVAEHSAEALVRLDDTQAIPELVDLLRPNKPLASAFEEDGDFFRQEVVAVNHLRNCLLCHAPSTSRADPSRGLVPHWERPLTRAYYEGIGSAVRADITYLTQDFSVVQTVDNPGPWPSDQRFDYMVYKKPVSEKAAQNSDKAKERKPYTNAIVFALQSLTGETPDDNSWENWSRIADRM